ncbi:hypothetical protein JOF35_008564 [Streptomyces demainii]|uniref:Transposase n=1 Tax=Streptomyces demainii TaxID=588122 RepID=A0ABT9L692_9ACTN|nr:hypothetical protein [Streptomyces demainii]
MPGGVRSWGTHPETGRTRAMHALKRARDTGVGTRHCRTPRPRRRSRPGNAVGSRAPERRKRTDGQHVCTTYVLAPPNPGTTMFRDRAKDCLTGQEPIPIVNCITCDRRPLPHTHERRKTVRRGDHSSSRHRRRPRPDSPASCLSRSRSRVPAASVGHPGHIHRTHRPQTRLLAVEAGFSHQLRPGLASSGELTAVTAQDSGGRLIDICPGPPGRRGHHGPGRRDPAVPQSLPTGKDRWPQRVLPEFIT